jgi:hypothetical protein
LADLGRGCDFYARLADGLGDYFLDSLFTDMDSLALNAGVHAKVYGYHRMLAKRFPFAVYYAVSDDVCIVWRVLDCRQNPARIRRGLANL